MFRFARKLVTSTVPTPGVPTKPQQQSLAMWLIFLSIRIVGWILYGLNERLLAILQPKGAKTLEQKGQLVEKEEQRQKVKGKEHLRPIEQRQQLTKVAKKKAKEGVVEVRKKQVEKKLKEGEHHPEKTAEEEAQRVIPEGIVQDRLKNAKPEHHVDREKFADKAEDRKWSQLIDDLKKENDSKTQRLGFLETELNQAKQAMRELTLENTRLQLSLNEFQGANIQGWELENQLLKKKLFEQQQEIESLQQYGEAAKNLLEEEKRVYHLKHEELKNLLHQQRLLHAQQQNDAVNREREKLKLQLEKQYEQKLKDYSDQAQTVLKEHQQKLHNELRLYKSQVDEYKKLLNEQQKQFQQQSQQQTEKLIPTKQSLPLPPSPKVEERKFSAKDSLEAAYVREIKPADIVEGKEQLAEQQPPKAEGEKKKKKKKKSKKKKQQGKEEIPAEVLEEEAKERKKAMKDVIKMEEEERQRRIKEDSVIDERKHRVDVLEPRDVQKSQFAGKSDQMQKGQQQQQQQKKQKEEVPKEVLEQERKEREEAKRAVIKMEEEERQRRIEEYDSMKNNEGHLDVKPLGERDWKQLEQEDQQFKEFKQFDQVQQEEWHEVQNRRHKKQQKQHEEESHQYPSSPITIKIK